MCKVKCERIIDGPGPGEAIVKIQVSGGVWEELVTPISSLEGKSLLKTSLIYEEDNRVLVELPRESSAGNWRVWVDRKNTI